VSDIAYIAACLVVRILMSELGNSPTVCCDPVRVLVTDDEAQIRKLFNTILTLGLPEIKVDVACNGLEAVKAFKEFHQSVLLMDLKMPEMDGLQAFITIRDLCAAENWQMPSVIFCTGFMPPETVNQIVGDGCHHGILHKPVKSAQIISAVQAKLGKK
jgi:CheY-like chemotaxis protein